MPKNPIVVAALVVVAMAACAPGKSRIDSVQETSQKIANADTGLVSQFDKRTIVYSPAPLLPKWVAAESQISATVSFTVMADGTVAHVSIESSSGFPEVDRAILTAVSKWKFNAIAGAAPARGTVPFTIQRRPNDKPNG